MKKTLRTYEADGLVIECDVTRCIHVEACVQGLPTVQRQLFWCSCCLISECYLPCLTKIVPTTCSRDSGLDRRNARSSCRSTRYSGEHDGIVVAGLRIVRFRIAGVTFGYGGHRRSSALERSARIAEEETTSCHPAPVLDAALQSPKLARREHPWVLPSQTLEQLLRRPMRFGFQPLHDAGPGRLERVPPGAPVSWRSLARTVRRPYLAGTPRERKTPQESVEVGIALRHRMDRRARGQTGQVMLNCANLVQQPERVHRAEHGAQSILHRNRDRVRRQQPSARRLRRVVALANAGTVARLLGELERRLEYVDEQARRRCRGGPVPRRRAYPPDGHTRPVAGQPPRSSARPRPGRSFDTAWTVSARSRAPCRRPPTPR